MSGTDTATRAGHGCGYRFGRGFKHWVRLVSTEIRIQFRGGLYAAYTAMTAFFFLILLLLPQDLRPRGFELIVFFDPGFMGFFFAGGLVLLEREQGILPLIVTHGHGFASYWRAKATAVLMLAVTVVAALAVISYGLGFIRITAAGAGIALTGLILTVPVFLSLGMVLAARFPRVLDYFVYSGLVMVPFMFPLVEVAGISVGPLGVLSPVWGGLVFFTSIFEPARSPVELAGAAGSLLVWNVLAYRWAGRAFTRLSAGAVAGRLRRFTRFRSSDRADGLHVSRVKRTLRFGGTTADVTLLLRDPMTRMILVAPLLASVVMGRGFPAVLGAVAGSGDAFEVVATAILSRMDYIRSFAILLGAFMYGMLGAFLILDEKDEGIIPVLRTMPGRTGWYVLRRGGTLLVLFALLLPLVIILGDLVHGSGPAFLVSLVVDAATLPVVFLSMSILARNKIQGLALAKVLNVFSIPPLLLAAVPGRTGMLIGLFPSGWGSLIRLRADSPAMVIAFAVIGLVYGGGVSLMLYRKLVI